MNNQHNRIANRILFIDEGSPLSCMADVQAMFDDNPDSGYTITEAMEQTGLSRSAVDTRVNELHKSGHITIIGKRHISKGVDRPIYQKSKANIKLIIKGQWAKGK